MARAPEAEAEDCAFAFVGHMLEDGGRRLAGMPAGEEAGRWLATCAVNWSIDWLRARQRRTSRELPLSAADEYLRRRAAWTDPVVAGVLASEFRVRVHACTQRLTTTQQDLVGRCVFGGQSISDASAELGKATDTVRHGLRAATRRLRQLLAEDGAPIQERAYHAARPVPRSRCVPAAAAVVTMPSER